MITVFRNNFDYINFVTSNPIKDGEVFCLSFIPSAFFPKDVIDYFFDKKEHLDEHKVAAEKLWKFGKQLLKCLDQKRICICICIGIELDALKLFIETGIVHIATKNFEATILVRINVIDVILQHLNGIVFFREQTPYVFRLIPPDVVVLDVAKNKSAQSIQGIALHDGATYSIFLQEFKRLTNSYDNWQARESVRKSLEAAKGTLRAGIKTTLNV